MKNLFAKLTEQDLLLFEAIRNGNIEKIEKSLNEGADINVFGDQYDVYTSISPLEYAIYCNANIEVITFLIDQGAKIDEVNDQRKRSILEIVICFYKDNKLVRYLLDKGAQFPTVQHRYAFEGNKKELQDIQGNIDNIKTPSGCTLLHYAVASAELNRVEWLLKERGASVDEKDIFGLTALSCAATKGHIRLVKWLLTEGGAKIDEKDNEGHTALWCAEMNGKQEVVQWLLTHGASS